jgi:hypothetical protein
VSDPRGDPFDWMFTSNEPDELRNYLALPGEGLRLSGSAVPAIGTFRQSDATRLVVPSSAAERAAPIDYMGVFLTLGEYAPYEHLGLDADDLIAQFSSNHTGETLVVHLALLNHLSRSPERLAAMAAGYERILRPEHARRFRNVLRGEAGNDRVRFVARQPILSAMRAVIERGAADTDNPDVPAMLAAIQLAHAAAGVLKRPEESGLRIAGAPEEGFFLLLRIALLYESDDEWSAIDRTSRIWRDCGERIARFRARADPEELLREATGLDLDEILALGFAVWAHSIQWEPGAPPFLDPGLGILMDRSKIDSFMAFTSTTIDELHAAFAQRSDSEFDFLPFEDRPVLRCSHGLIALDAGYLWNRFTSGLYWLVHDHEKSRSERDRQRWTQAFGEAVEMFAEDALRPIAPPVFGGVSFYTEEDFEEAYGTKKRCDAAVDFGDCVMLVEVVSGGLSLPTRIEGERAKFEGDTKRLVTLKCEQLHEAANAVLDNVAALTGAVAPPGLRVLPVLLVGGGYPMSPFTMSYIEEELAARGFLKSPRIDSLCIIDLGELEMLEGLAERGPSPVDVLRGWKTSGIGDVPLRNFVIAKWGGGRDLRPARMDAPVHATFERIFALLKVVQP